VRRKDPLAQIFSLDSLQPTFIKSVSVWFAAKPTVDSTSLSTNITLEIRAVSGGSLTEGIPAGVPEAERVINALVSKTRQEVNIGNTATEFVFDDPVLLQPKTNYALVLKTESPEYQVYVAKLGELDLANNAQIKTQPYPEGSLLQSADDKFWQQLPGTDLAFVLNAYTLNETAEYEFNAPAFALGSNQAIGFYLSSLENLPQYIGNANQVQQSSIRWAYSTDGGTNWVAFSTNSYIYTKSTFTSLKFKAYFASTIKEENAVVVSPVLLKDSLNLKLLTREADKVSRYTSKAMTLASGYRYVSMSAKLSLPTPDAKCEWWVTDETNGPLSVPAYSTASAYTAGEHVTYNNLNYLAQAAAAANESPESAPAKWTRVELTKGWVWHLVSNANQTVTPVAGSSEYQEYERTFDFGVSTSLRTKFRYMITLSTGSVTSPPKVRDIVAICHA
jgi:hypothetical protein